MLSWIGRIEDGIDDRGWDGKLLEQFSQASGPVMQELVGRDPILGERWVLRQTCEGARIQDYLLSVFAEQYVAFEPIHEILGKRVQFFGSRFSGFLDKHAGTVDRMATDGDHGHSAAMMERMDFCFTRGADLFEPTRSALQRLQAACIAKRGDAIDVVAWPAFLGQVAATAQLHASNTMDRYRTIDTAAETAYVQFADFLRGWVGRGFATHRNISWERAWRDDAQRRTDSPFGCLLAACLSCDRIHLTRTRQVGEGVDPTQHGTMKL